MGQRLARFEFEFTVMLRAAEALLPYGLAKVTPDAAPVVPVQVVFQAPQGGQAVPAMRDVTPSVPEMAPPPMPWEMQQNQSVADAAQAASDAARRTEGASD